MDSKRDRLRGILRGLDNALIAYSGGIDSLFLAKVAYDCLQDRVIALTALSPSFPSYELEEAKKSAAFIGIRHLIVETREVERAEYRANRGDRCYYCKTELYEVCWNQARQLGFGAVLNGTHLDDLGDYRPGLRAAHEWKARSPLVEAGFRKNEIREWARELGLPGWNKPALACLSSRFPPGTEVTEERLRRIDRIESSLRQLGLSHFRVRFHEPIARIEVDESEIRRLLDPEIRLQVTQVCRENGFLYTTLDLDGYRSGGRGGVTPPLPLHQIK